MTRHLQNVRFGSLTALEPTDKRSFGSIVWKCRCDCGNIILRSAGELDRTKNQNCGHKVSYDTYVGKKFGHLVILSRQWDQDKKESYLLCQCDCGNRKLIRGYSVIHGIIKSCGCLREKISVGDTYNRLTVLQAKERNKRGVRLWKCVCSCGHIRVVDANSILSGRTKSCKKCSGASVDHTGKTFRDLFVLEKLPNYRYGTAYYRCRCKCGNETIVHSSQLTSSSTVGCKECGDKRRGDKLRTHGMTGTKEYRRYLDRNREERKRKLDSGWTFEMEAALKQLFPACILCGSTVDLCVDHIRPLSHGYGLRPDNATILCNKCNIHKSNTPLNNLPKEMKNRLLLAALSFQQYWQATA